MSKREERKSTLERKAQRFREQAERQRTLSVWDLDPKKQYVRRFGWLGVIEDFVERRREAGIDRPLRYLTIPGPNASDIGLLWRAGLLTRTGDGLPYVAICDRSSAEQVVANLGQLGGYSSAWFREAVRWPNGDLSPLFPFDVINLDLCGCAVTGATSRDRALRRLISIRSILQLQKGQNFLLLLTASANDQGARSILEEVIAGNLTQEERFREAFARRYAAASVEVVEDFRSLVQIAVPKMIARRAKRYGYQTLEHFAAKYDRQNSHMFCHSFEFDFLGRRKREKKYEPYFDRVPLLDEASEEPSAQVQKKALDAYIDFVSNLPGRQPEDIESTLRDDPGLEAELAGEAESLIRWWEQDQSTIGVESDSY